MLVFDANFLDLSDESLRVLAARGFQAPETCWIRCSREQAVWMLMWSSWKTKVAITKTHNVALNSVA